MGNQGTHKLSLNDWSLLWLVAQNNKDTKGLCFSRAVVVAGNKKEAIGRVADKARELNASFDITKIVALDLGELDHAPTDVNYYTYFAETTGFTPRELLNGVICLEVQNN